MHYESNTIDFLIIQREYYYTLLVEIWCGYTGN